MVFGVSYCLIEIAQIGKMSVIVASHLLGFVHVP